MEVAFHKHLIMTLNQLKFERYVLFKPLVNAAAISSMMAILLSLHCLHLFPLCVDVSCLALVLS